ncbi:MAG TPA: hypothetical protein VGB25_03860 [Candidatus Binatia bacterium]
MSEIPKIEDSGSKGTQETGSGEIKQVTPEFAFEGLPIVDVVQGLAASNARSLGGHVVANLVAGSLSQISIELQDARKELKAVRADLDATRDKLSCCRIDEAVLRGRISDLTQGRHLRNFAIASGTLLLPIGFELNRNNYGILSIFIGGIGLILVLMGWLWHFGEATH